jgi:hypothetical protein
MSGFRWMRGSGWGVFVVAATMGAGCSLYHYDPVTEVDVDDLAARGCKDGDRVTTRAELNQVYEDALVLWDGLDPATTVTVELKGQGIGGKTKAVFGENRYERAYDALRELQASEQPLDITVECRGKHKTPVATRFSYREKGGEEIAFEFNE